MQYLFFKTIIETILSNYFCPECHNNTNEKSLQITGISSHGVDIHIHCHVCGTHSQLNAEVNNSPVQMLESDEGKKQFEKFLNSGGAINATPLNRHKDMRTNENSIKDEDIIKIHNDLKNAKSIEDLMN